MKLDNQNTNKICSFRIIKVIVTYNRRQIVLPVILIHPVGVIIGIILILLSKKLGEKL
jgi:hypothetical protein